MVWWRPDILALETEVDPILFRSGVVICERRRPKSEQPHLWGGQDLIEHSLWRPRLRRCGSIEEVELEVMDLAAEDPREYSHPATGAFPYQRGGRSS